MRLRRLDAITDAGGAGRPNDDAMCVGPGIAAVLDGATGLGSRLLDVPSDAAWVAERGAERLLHHAGAHRGRDLLSPDGHPGGASPSLNR
jgi:hypothetical protein